MTLRGHGEATKNFRKGVFYRLNLPGPTGHLLSLFDRTEIEIDTPAQIDTKPLEPRCLLNHFDNDTFLRSQGQNLEHYTLASAFKRIEKKSLKTVKAVWHGTLRTVQTRRSSFASESNKMTMELYVWTKSHLSLRREWYEDGLAKNCPACPASSLSMLVPVYFLGN